VNRAQPACAIKWADRRPKAAQALLKIMEGAIASVPPHRDGARSTWLTRSNVSHGALFACITDVFLLRLTDASSLRR
jgi:hypothetical protein